MGRLRPPPAGMLLLTLVCSVGLRGEARAHVPHDHVTGVWMSPAFDADQTAFALVREVPMRTTDGQRWTRLSNGVGCYGRTTAMAISPAYDVDGRVLIACTQSIFVSHDGGEAFQLRNDQVRGVIQAAVMMPLDPRRPNQEVFFTLDEAGRVMRSLDGGRSWREVLGAGARSIYGAAGGLWIGTDDGRLLRMAIGGPIAIEERCRLSPSIPVIALAPADRAATAWFVGTAGRGLFRFEAATGRCAPTGRMAEGTVTAIATRDVAGGGQELWLTLSEQAVLRSVDGGRGFRLFRRGLRTHHQARLYGDPSFGALAVSARGTILVGGFCGLGRSEDPEQGFTLAHLSWGHIAGLSVNEDGGDDVVLAAGYGGGAAVFRPSTASWELGMPGIHKTRLGASGSAASGPGRSVMVATSFDAAFVSRDGGRSFAASSLSPPSGSVGALKRRLMSAARARTPLLFRALSRWLPTLEDAELMATPEAVALSPDFNRAPDVFLGVAPNGLLRSQDGGERFELIWDGAGEPVRTIAISPGYVDDHTVWVATRSAVWRSVRAGRDLKPCGPPARAKRPLLATASDLGGHVLTFFGGREGVWVTAGSCAGWTRLDLPDGDERIDAIALSPAFAHDRTFLIKGAGRPGRLCTLAEDYAVACENLPALTFQLSPFVARDGNGLVAFSPGFAHNHTLYAANHFDLMVSADRGQTWTAHAKPIRYEPELAREQWVQMPVVRSGPWEREGSLDGRGPWIASEDAQAALDLTFFGRRVDVVGRVGPGLGNARVLLDGAPVGRIEGYRRRGALGAVLFRSAELAEGQPHHLRIEVLGEAARPSTGTRVSIDAFHVFR